MNYVLSGQQIKQTILLIKNTPVVKNTTINEMELLIAVKGWKLEGCRHFVRYSNTSSTSPDSARGQREGEPGTCDAYVMDAENAPIVK